jgi:thymidylate synthase
MLSVHVSKNLTRDLLPCLITYQFHGVKDSLKMMVYQQYLLLSFVKNLNLLKKLNLRKKLNLATLRLIPIE